MLNANLSCCVWLRPQVESICTLTLTQSNHHHCETPLSYYQTFSLWGLSLFAQIIASPPLCPYSPPGKHSEWMDSLSDSSKDECIFSEVPVILGKPLTLTASWHGFTDSVSCVWGQSSKSANEMVHFVTGDVLFIYAARWTCVSWFSLIESVQTCQPTHNQVFQICCIIN